MKIGLILLLVFGFGIVLFLVVWNRVNPQNNSSKSSNVSWEFDYGSTNTWKVSGNPPACPDPLVFDPPVDVSLASGILYPGQYRGGDYKPHGGFRFDNNPTNEVSVVAPIDGYLVSASGYLEGGEVQYLLVFINDCGIMYKLDHLLTLAPKFAEIMGKIPTGGEGDSRTTNIDPKVFVAKGEEIATEIGFRNFQGRKNIGIDFGLYDLRTTNQASKDQAYVSKHKGEEQLSFTALCWFDYLTQPSRATVKNLSAVGQEGNTSDYCN